MALLDGSCYCAIPCSYLELWKLLEMCIKGALRFVLGESMLLITQFSVVLVSKYTTKVHMSDSWVWIVLQWNSGLTYLGSFLFVLFNMYNQVCEV